MTISSTGNRATYAGNGVTVAFAFPYQFQQNTDLVVYEQIVATGATATLVLGTDYTVTGAGLPGGGTVTRTVATATGTNLVIVRTVPLTQGATFPNNTAFDGPTVEGAYDKLTTLAQQLNDAQSRSPTLGSADVDGSGSYDAKSNKIKNLANATNAQDAVAKAQLDAAVISAAGFTPSAGSISTVPAGTNVETNVQATLTGIDTRKAPLASPALTGTPTAPTAAVGDSSTKLATTAFAAGVATVYGIKNRLVNGGMEVWQRGAGGAASIAQAASLTAYTADRWAFLTGANQASVVSQVAGLTNPSRWAAKILRNAGQTGTTLQWFEQPFELDNLALLRGQTLTLSFSAKAGANWSPASGTLSYAVYCGTGAAAKRSAGAYTTETTPITGSVNLTTSVSRTVAVSTAIPVGTTQMSVAFTWTPVGTAGADDSFFLDDVQLEIGGAATPFELRPFDTELFWCQRYFQKSFFYNTAPQQNNGVGTGEAIFMAGKNAAATNISQTWVYAPRLRVTPTFTTYNPAAANAQARDVTAAVDCSATTAGPNNELNFGMSCTGNAATAVGNQLRFHWSADAEL
jgi:hypothetical protein